MINMLHRALQSPERKVVFVHGARNGSVHAMKDHRRQIEQKQPDFMPYIFYSEPLSDDQPGKDYDFSGSVEIEEIKDAVMSPEADYYICGPILFMRMQYDALIDERIPETRIH